MWQETEATAIYRFREAFLELEVDGELDEENEYDMEVLHAIFLPKIQRILDSQKVFFSFRFVLFIFEPICQ